MSKRINISVSDSVYLTLKSMSDDYGIPLSSLGSMAMMSWLEQKQAITAMGDVKGVMSKIMAFTEKTKEENLKLETHLTKEQFADKYAAKKE